MHLCQHLNQENVSILVKSGIKENWNEDQLKHMKEWKVKHLKLSLYLLKQMCNWVREYSSKSRISNLHNSNLYTYFTINWNLLKSFIKYICQIYLKFCLVVISLYEERQLYFPFNKISQKMFHPKYQIFWIYIEGNTWPLVCCWVLLSHSLYIDMLVKW